MTDALDRAALRAADEAAVTLLREDVGASRAEVVKVAVATALRGLHNPFSIYDECEHQHEEGEPGVVDTGEYLACQDALMYRVCGHCCVDHPWWQGQTEVCVDHHKHGPGEPICETVRILDAYTGPPDA